MTSCRWGVLESKAMEAVAWSALVLLAGTLVGAIFWLGPKIDNQGAALAARIDAQGGRIDAQGAELGSRINAQTARIDHLVSQVAELSANLGRQTARIDVLTERIDEHLGRHAS
jgi:uncharacterized coiled-coil protein SlyX